MNGTKILNAFHMFSRLSIREWIMLASLQMAPWPHSTRVRAYWPSWLAIGKLLLGQVGPHVCEYGPVHVASGHAKLDLMAQDNAAAGQGKLYS